MFQRRDYADNELVNVALRVNGRLLRGIHQVAERQGYASTTKWLSAAILPIVAHELGVTEASLQDTPRAVTQRPPTGPAVPPEIAVQLARAETVMAEFAASLAALRGGATVPAPKRVTRGRR